MDLSLSVPVTSWSSALHLTLETLAKAGVPKEQRMRWAERAIARKRLSQKRRQSHRRIERQLDAYQNN